LRRIGSAVDLADMRGPFEPSGAGDVIIAGDGTKRPLLCDVEVLLSILVRFGDVRYAREDCLGCAARGNPVHKPRRGIR
jgi:hypothetical protein